MKKKSRAPKFRKIEKLAFSFEKERSLKQRPPHLQKHGQAMEEGRWTLTQGSKKQLATHERVGCEQPPSKGVWARAGMAVVLPVEVKASGGSVLLRSCLDPLPALQFRAAVLQLGPWAANRPLTGRKRPQHLLLFAFLAFCSGSGRFQMVASLSRSRGNLPQKDPKAGRSLSQGVNHGWEGAKAAAFTTCSGRELCCTEKRRCK